LNWDAKWIWLEGEPAPKNAVVNFRRAFRLEEPITARLHISTDCRYLLHINGERIGYGPSRNYHAHYEYDSYPLELPAGENVIAVEVLHWGESTFQHIAARCGLLLQLETEGKVLIRSDQSWHGEISPAFERNTPRIACQLAFEEQFDARLEEIGWTQTGFDDSAWETALEFGPVGIAPWGNITPRTIPFLTDAPTNLVRLRSSIMKRPEVVAAVRAGPYLFPGDVSANKYPVDALLATVLQVPTAGEVTLKLCKVYGNPILWLDGVKQDWQSGDPDVAVRVTLEAGDHVILLDWLSEAHDFDLTLTASSVPGLRVSSLLGGETETWMIATQPGDARAVAQTSMDARSLLESGADWRTVPEHDTPSVDVYMAMTASLLLEKSDLEVSLPLEVTPVDDGQARRYVVDFGRELIGWIELEVTALDGAILDLLGFEGVQDGRIQITENMNNTLRYTCRTGRQKFVSTQRRGLRYVILDVHNSSEPVKIHHVGVRLSTYPWTNACGTFRSSDSRLNQIYDASAYMLRLCSEDTFTDCPTFEQTLWVGDACHSSILFHQYAHGNPRLPERNLRLAAQSLERLPITNSQVPGDWENMLIPNWSFFWVMGCLEQYHLTGSLAFVRELFPALEKQAHTIEVSRNAAGLFDFQENVWHFLDWSRMDSPRGSIPAHENCLAVASLRATASLAETLGELERASHWNVLADQISESINRVFWCESEQAYVDSLHADGTLSRVVSQATNITALISGVAGARADALREQVVQPPEHWAKAGTSWMTMFVCEQLAQTDRTLEMLRILRDHWGEMLDRGATTIWETFAGAYTQDENWTRSWCHAWSSAPLYLLPAYVLGVRPLEPGFKHALIAPQLGDLEWAEGRVPTPYGEIEMRAEQDGATLHLEVRLPADVSATVQLPEPHSPIFVNNEPVKVAVSAGVRSLTLPPGSNTHIHSSGGSQ
jgi:alpha-L-rhamnosidase